MLRYLAVVGCFLIAGCSPLREKRQPKPEPITPHVAAPLPSAAQQIDESPAAVPTPPTCSERIAASEAGPGLPGAPALEAVRRQFLLQAKAEPVQFVRAPEFINEPFLPSVQRNRALLNRTEHPWDVIKRLLEQFAIAPREGRETLLRDGYLYTENPELAFALLNQISAEHLFGHDTIWIERGSVLMHAERVRGRYRFTDGPNQGELVRLLLLDRIGTGPVTTSRLTRDWRSLQYALHFTAARVRHITEEAIVADLEYGNTWVPSLLRASGTNLSLDCEVAPPGAALDTFRREAERRQHVVQLLRATILDEVDEQLPFDEPRREWGLQLDGKLRSNWKHAYQAGQRSFGLNGDLYFVFDKQGRPLVPQVCVDFLVDTFERTSGNWFRRQGEPAGRTVGKFNLDANDIVERARFRRVPDFIAWTQDNPDKFEVLELPEDERVELGDRPGLLSFLERRKQDFQPGDVVVIRGPTPWDPTQMHYHSFFVFEKDPITGIPIAVVGNAGRPTIRTLETEVRRTPERRPYFRLRPTTRWLEQIAATNQRIPEDPLPLSPRGNAGW